MKKKALGMAAAILAGGKNSRMAGFNKAHILVAGIPLIQRTLGLLEKVFDEIILVTNAPKDFRPYEKKVLMTQDIIKDRGPLGGIHAALSVTSKEAVFFVACDMPFLHNDIIRTELDYFDRADCDSLVPRIGPWIEPLCAIYKKRLKEKMELYLGNQADHSVRGFLKTLDPFYLELDDTASFRHIFKNLNEPNDLKEAGLS